MQLTISENAMNKIDLYLSRMASFVQIGLFVVTLLTLYFTVIPLYKSAQMEEVLAKKELELESMNRKIKDLYITMRRSETQDLAELATDCTGWRQLVLNEAKPGDSLYKNVISCVDEVVGRYDLSRFKDMDRLLLKDRVAAIKLQVVARQNYFRIEYDSYSRKLRADPAAALPLESDNLSGKLDELMREIGVALPESQEDEFEINVMRGRTAIELNYLEEVTDVIRGISNVSWAE